LGLGVWGLGTGDEVIRTLEQAKSLAKQLYALRNALTRKRDSPTPSP